jgi:hypothetical protein
MPQEIPEDKKDNPRTAIKQDLEAPNQKQIDDEEDSEDTTFQDMMEGNDLDPDPNDEDSE